MEDSKSNGILKRLIIEHFIDTLGGSLTLSKAPNEVSSWYAKDGENGVTFR